MESERPSIREVLEFYGAEVSERSGWTAMLCPFHDDRMRSASVNTGRGAFKCFGCEAMGDSWSLIMFKEGIGFRDAVEFGKRFDGDSDQDLRTVRPGGRGLPGRARAGSGARRYLPPGVRPTANGGT